ncbi:MAG: nucleotidyltransferase domain-containing protein [Candidatus Woesearchaeota archaeon]
MDNKLKIINYLGKHWRKKFTMHELSKLLNIPYASFYRTIEKMKDLIVIDIVGNSKTIKLNRDNNIIHSYLTISSEEEKKEFLKKQSMIKVINENINTNDVALIFGSCAKGKETKKSDLDIMIINKKGDKTISFSKHELLFNIEINPIFFSEKEFKLMLENKEENVGKQALEGHIILNNPKRFWELVLDAIQ